MFFVIVATGSKFVATELIKDKLFFFQFKFFFSNKYKNYKIIPLSHFDESSLSNNEEEDDWEVKRAKLLGLAETLGLVEVEAEVEAEAEVEVGALWLTEVFEEVEAEAEVEVARWLTEVFDFVEKRSFNLLPLICKKKEK